MEKKGLITLGPDFAFFIEVIIPLALATLCDATQ
jgi:hypothetical protein